MSMLVGARGKGSRREVDSLLPGVEELIRQRLIFHRTERSGPYSGGTRAISWDEGEVRGIAHTNTEHFSVICVQAIESYEREIFNPYSRVAIASNRAESIDISSNKNGRIVVFYWEKTIDKPVEQVDTFETPSLSVERLSMGGEYSKDALLLEYDHVGVVHLERDIIEVSWQNSKGNVGPQYRIDLERKSIEEIKE